MSKYKVGFYTAKHTLENYVISNYFDMTERRDNEDKKIFL